MYHIVLFALYALRAIGLTALAVQTAVRLLSQPQNQQWFFAGQLFLERTVPSCTRCYEFVLPNAPDDHGVCQLWTDVRQIAERELQLSR